MSFHFSLLNNFQKIFHPSILMGIFMNLADCCVDRMDDGHADGWLEFEVESYFG